MDGLIVGTGNNAHRLKKKKNNYPAPKWNSRRVEGAEEEEEEEVGSVWEICRCVRMPRPDMDVSEASRREQGENPVSGEAAGLEKKYFLKKFF